MYTRFYGISKRSNPLLSLLKSRIHHGDAYKELLQLCKIKYCKIIKNNNSVSIRALVVEIKRIISFGSWRTWPCKKLSEKPKPIYGAKNCGNNNHTCFQVEILSIEPYCKHIIAIDQYILQ